MDLTIHPALSQWLTERGPTLYPLGVAVILLFLVSYLARPKLNADIPWLSGAIPRISTTLLYVNNMPGFFEQTKVALAKKGIVQFYLGPMKTYFVTGTNSVRAIFRSAKEVSSDSFFLIAQARIWDATKEDLAKFKNDKSGRLKVPLPGFENVPDKERYWAGMHEVMHRYLSRPNETHVLAMNYQRYLEERFDTKFPLHKAKQVGVFDFLRDDMGMATTTAFNGKKILDMFPNILDLLWEFEDTAPSLVWGLPKWLNRGPVGNRDRFSHAVQTYLKAARPEMERIRKEDKDWEPVFGSRYVRELVNWTYETDLAMKTRGGCIMVLTIFAYVFFLSSEYHQPLIFLVTFDGCSANANTIPIATWCVIELARSPALFAAVREEVATAYETDPATGKKTLNISTLLSLPLLQSVYAEILRLHVSLIVLRKIASPLSVAGYTLEKGASIQAATDIDHFDDNVWGSEGHPAREFWPERHVKTVDGKRQFVFAGSPYDFFPYGEFLSLSLSLSLWRAEKYSRDLFGWCTDS